MTLEDWDGTDAWDWEDMEVLAGKLAAQQAMPAPTDTMEVMKRQSVTAIAVPMNMFTSGAAVAREGPAREATPLG